MRKLRAFFYVFYKSISSPSYYKDVVASDKWLSLKYFFSLALLASLVASVYTLVPLVPKVEDALSVSLEKVVSMYEDDLEITIKDGKLSTNRETPYIVPVPTEEKVPEGTPANLLVIDVDGTVDDFLNKYNSYVLINSSNAMFDDSSGIKVESLSQLPDTVITKQTVLDFSSRVSSLLGFVPYILSVMMFFGLFIYYAVFRFFYLFVVALLLFAFGRMKKLAYTYTDYVKISIHTLTMPLVIESTVNIFRFNLIDRFPMWFIVVNVVYGAVVLYNLSKDSTVDKPSD